MSPKCNQRYLITYNGGLPDVIKYQEAIDFLRSFDHIQWESISNIVDDLDVGSKYWVNDQSILVRLKDSE